MIPWMKDKLSRSKWMTSRKRDQTPSTVNDGISTSAAGIAGSSRHINTIHHNQTSISTDFKTSKLKQSSSSLVPKEQIHESKEKMKIRIISPNSKIIHLQTSRNKKLIDLKHEALIELSEDSGALPLFSPDVRQLIPKYRFIRPENNTNSTTSLTDSNIANNSRLNLTNNNSPFLNESLTLSQLNINNNDTLILSTRRTPLPSQQQQQQPQRDTNRGPRAEEIELATSNITSNSVRGTQRVDVNDLVLQNDIQLDVRKVLISLAQQGAYIIGCGPYAKRLISMLKQKILNKRRHQSDTLQCLVDMGFSKEKARYALKINNGTYMAALDWLIHQHSEEVPATESDPQMSGSKIQTPRNTIENIEALLEIVRIYSHRETSPPREDVAALVEMGFSETDVLEAFKKTHNNQAAAAEWLCGNRSASLMELRDGLSQESPILKAMLESPQVQMSLGNPKIFIAYLSMLENQNALSMWLGDSETSSVISHILRKYHEEKHVLGINQFNASSGVTSVR